jgi:cellulose synthase/poly-beta-1,6-N-acetylglucosamine synthase-like glycosyltransferase
VAEVVFLGLRFTSWAEVAFVLALAAPLAFFGYCTFTLWRLLLAALPARSQVAIHALPTGSTVHAAESRVVASPPAAVEKTEQACFILLVPAHNEELLLGEILDALHGLDYPRTAYRLLVIADNCSDRTAEIARAHGALVLERFDSEKIGKGYALEWALQALLCPTDTEYDDLRAAADFDAIVILDADTKVAPDLLQMFANGLAAGHKVMQARYDVLNAAESWRSRLMTCALALVHLVKPLGREQLKLSDGLKGNGMCFAREVVEQVPWSGASITEDIEYTLRLCRAGYRVAFLPGATVWAQMPTTGAQATSQRQRWEGGRYRLLFSVAPGLLWEGVRKHDRILRDRAMELIVPPFAEMFAGPVALLGLCALAAWVFGWPWAAGLAWAWGAVLALQVGYLLGGLWVARVPKTVAMALLGAPLYIVWKFGVYAVMAVRGSGSGWQRTERRRL